MDIMELLTFQRSLEKEISELGELWLDHRLAKKNLSQLEAAIEQISEELRKVNRKLRKELA